MTTSVPASGLAMQVGDTGAAALAAFNTTTSTPLQDDDVLVFCPDFVGREFGEP